VNADPRPACSAICTGPGTHGLVVAIAVETYVVRARVVVVAIGIGRALGTLTALAKAAGALDIAGTLSTTIQIVVDYAIAIVVESVADLRSRYHFSDARAPVPVVIAGLLSCRTDTNPGCSRRTGVARAGGTGQTPEASTVAVTYAVCANRACRLRGASGLTSGASEDHALIAVVGRVAIINDFDRTAAAIADVRVTVTIDLVRDPGSVWLECHRALAATADSRLTLRVLTGAIAGSCAPCHADPILASSTSARRTGQWRVAAISSLTDRLGAFAGVVRALGVAGAPGGSGRSALPIGTDARATLPAVGALRALAVTLFRTTTTTWCSPSF
jgi:hypothetical protein